MKNYTKTSSREADLREPANGAHPRLLPDGRHAFVQYKQTPYCGLEIDSGFARCGLRATDKVHLSDDIEGITLPEPVPPPPQNEGSMKNQIDEANPSLPNQANPRSLAPEQGLVAGRELDMAVLEWVIGSPRPDPITRPLEYDHLPIRRNGWTWIDTRGGWVSFCNYSTDIAAAMEVVEKMREQGFSVAITGDNLPVPWDAAFKTRQSSYGQTGHHLPEAICRAALAAVTREDQDGK